MKIGKFEKVLKELPSIDINEIKELVEKRCGLMSDKEALAKVGTSVKTYMTSDEKERFSWLLLTSIFGDLYRKTLVSFGNITKEEHRELKTGLTHLDKFTNLVLERLDPKIKNELLDKVRNQGLEIKLIDAKTSMKFRESLHADREYARIKAEQFYDLSENILRIHCKECGIQFNECRNIYDIFVDNQVPESGHNLSNCPYAYNEASDYQRYIQSLQEIREQKIGIAMDPKFESIREMLESEINALDVSIAALASIKKGNIKGPDSAWVKDATKGAESKIKEINKEKKARAAKKEKKELELIAETVKPKKEVKKSGKQNKTE